MSDSIETETKPEVTKMEVEEPVADGSEVTKDEIDSKASVKAAGVEDILVPSIEGKDEEEVKQLLAKVAKQGMSSDSLNGTS